MSGHITPFDLSNIPDLKHMVEEVKKSKKPRIVQWQGEPVAILMPLRPGTESHKSIDTYDHPPLNKLKKSFLNAGYPEAEVKDILEALSELPQYASQVIS